MNQNTRTPSASPHPIALWLLKTMLWVLGLSALVPGVEMMMDPSGKAVGFPEGALAGSPFPNYLIPGFLLTAFIGLLALVAWYALWKKPSSAFIERINPFPKQHWGWTIALMSGFSLIIWILVQMMMVPYFFLQPTLLTWGAVIVLLCYIPGIKAYYSKPVR